MAVLKIRRGSVHFELEDSNGRMHTCRMDDAYLDPDDKLKVKYFKNRESEAPYVERILE
jgi:hypothetical protein